MCGIKVLPAGKDFKKIKSTRGTAVKEDEVGGIMALVVQKVLSIKLGEVVALMGPNGSGKTSLALGIIGHKNYPLAGKVILDGEDISRLPIDQRVKKGLFLAWQNPVGVRGVSVRQMLKTIGKAEDLEKTARQLRIGKHLLTRDININFSGGEKKKIQLLEMAVLQPKYAILDEIDSGMDLSLIHI